tara:strand:- start:4051 stop:4428 length:378 start_codon:yes stop_codon:yes gene_type:complete
MPKRKLKEIAEDMGVSFDEAMEIATLQLEEDMLSGKGKNTWVNEAGQDIIDSYVPIPQVYRGRVIGTAPNPRYIYVYVKEMVKKVVVSIPARMLNKSFKDKYVYIEADNSGEETKFKWIPAPIVD